MNDKIDLKTKMMRYMSAEELAFSTIDSYSKTYNKLKYEVGELENRGNYFWTDYLASIPNPVYRNNVRSVILKVCRDVLGENLKLPIVNRPFILQPIYSIEEVSKIFARIKNPKHYAIACLLFTESMRINEILSIKLSDCLKKEGAVILRNTKTNKDYKKYLDKTTIEAIHKYLVWAKSRNQYPKVRLFEGWGSERYSATSVRMFMKKAMRLAGVEIKGSCHIFRRSASVWKIENDWTANHIAASLNNSVKTVNKYYAYARPEYLQALQKPVPSPLNQIPC